MNTVVQARPGPHRCRVAPSALALLESARCGLAGAVQESGAGARYVAAHLAALRAAAAVVAARSAPGTVPRRRGAPRSVWELLPRVEPALAEWAAFFAAGAGKRAAAEAGLQPAPEPRGVERRDVAAVAGRDDHRRSLTPRSSCGPAARTPSRRSPA